MRSKRIRKKLQWHLQSFLRYAQTQKIITQRKLEYLVVCQYLKFIKMLHHYQFAFGKIITNLSVVRQKDES